MIYEHYFALTQRPFSIAPNPQFLFAAGQYKEALAVLEYGVHHRGGFVLLTGEVGTGKTTLAKHIIAHAPHDTELALIIHSQLDRLAFLQQICSEFAVRFDASAQESVLIASLNTFLLDVYAKGGYSLLIIDEAQHLSFEVLELVRLLTNLETNTEKLLQIILLGQPELKHRLAQYNLRQLNQRFTARFHLRALSVLEVNRYIHYRLQVAGNSEHLFTWPAILMLHRRSGGIPRLINVLADRCLMGCYAHDRRKVGALMVSKAATEVFGEPAKSGLISKFAIWVLVIAIGAFALDRFDIGHTLSSVVAHVSNVQPAHNVNDDKSVISNNCQKNVFCWQGEMPAQLLVGRASFNVLNDAGHWVSWDGRVQSEIMTIAINLPAEYFLNQAIKQGDEHPLLVWIERVLTSHSAASLQDISNWQRIEPLQNFAVVENITNTYDQKLAWQVKHFQQEYQLQVDGVIGMQTITALYLLSLQEGL